MAINKISETVKENIKRKSAFGLPNRPSDMGMKPEEIKRAFYAPITDTVNSIFKEIDRVVEETNKALDDVVPTPTTEANGKFLGVENGQYAFVDAPQGGTPTEPTPTPTGIEIVQTTGESTTAVMSQKAVTEAIANAIDDTVATVLNTPV